MAGEPGSSESFITSLVKETRDFASLDFAGLNALHKQHLDAEQAKEAIAASERKEIREDKERREIRKMRLGIGGVLFVSVVVLLCVRAFPPDRQPAIVEKVLTAFLGAIPGALAGFLFGKEGKEKERTAE